MDTHWKKMENGDKEDEETPLTIKELEKLRTENDALKCKVRSYHTLNELCQDLQKQFHSSQEEIHYLRNENKILKQKLIELEENKNQLMPTTMPTDIGCLDDDLQVDSLPSIDSTTSGHLNETNMTNHYVRQTSRNKGFVGVGLLRSNSQPAASNGGAACEPLSENYAVSSMHSEITSLDVNTMEQILGQQTGVTGSPALKNSASTTLHIAKLEKSVRTYKEHNKALLAETKQQHEEIEHLRHENMQLLKKQHEKLRDDISPMSSMSSNGWVNVKPSSVHAYKSEDADQTKVVTVTPVGSDSNIAKYKEHIDNLLSANHKWEEHSNKLQADFDRQIGYIEKEKNDLTRQIQELKTSEEKRQVDIDRILLSAKKRYQDEETQKEEILQELHLVKVQKEKLQQQLSALERQVVDQPVLTKERSQMNPVVQDVDRNIRALEEEIVVLQQQITTYQEDFENERRDRERIQQLKEQYKEQLDNARIDKANTDRQLLTQNHTMQNLRRMKEEVEYELNVTKRELSDLRRAAIKPVMMFRPAVPYEPAPAPWACTQCTYENHGMRTVCEICGQHGRPNSSRNMNGLFGFQGNLMTDQSPQQPRMPRGRDVPDTDGGLVQHVPSDRNVVHACEDPGDLTTDNGVHD